MVAVAALFLAPGLAAVGPARAADALVAVGDELAVGKNRTGETCKVRQIAPTVTLTTTMFDVYGKSAVVGRAAALRTAQLKLMGEQATSHPSFWAPFVVVGDGGAP